MRAAGSVFLVTLLFGCSSGRVIVARSESVGLSKIAVVLDEAPLGTRPERVEGIREAVEQALKTREFSVLSRSMVTTICPEAVPCDNGKLISKFDLDGVGHLNLSSVTTSNFLVGYVASIGGTLTFTAADGSILEQVKHREGENSGILANTGQVLGALSSQADAFSGDSFAALSNAFGRKLVAQLAAPRKRNNAPRSLELRDVKVAEVNGLVRVCVLGSPNSSVVLEGKKSDKFSLREGDAGTYCGAFRFFPPGPVTVRLTDAFGAGEQRMITPIMECAELDRDPELKFVTRASLVVKAAPQRKLECGELRNILYISPGAAGPFTKIASLSGMHWEADAATVARIRATDGATYAFLSSPVRLPAPPIVKQLATEAK